VPKSGDGEPTDAPRIGYREGMPSPREVRRQERRQNRQQDVALGASSPRAARWSPMWLVLIAALGGAAIAGAVVFEMTRPSSKPEVTAPTGSVPMTMPVTPSLGNTPAYTPAPPGEAPPGKVWSPEHGHWHDITPGMPQ